MRDVKITSDSGEIGLQLGIRWNNSGTFVEGKEISCRNIAKSQVSDNPVATADGFFIILTLNHSWNLSM